MNITKALLIFPPCPIPKMFPKRVQVPLGITYLASALRKEHIKVSLLDSLIEGWDSVIELDTHNIQFGLTPAEIAERAYSLSPDIVGISCMYSIQAKVTSEIAREIKQRLPDVKICSGGAHSSAMPEEVATDKNIDFVVMGEGEATLIDIINALNNNTPFEDIDGVCYRTQDGRVVLNQKTRFIENLDNIPSPALDLLPMERYFEVNRPHGTITKNRRVVPIVTSRGCPAKCVFCSIHPVWGRLYRTRSPESVVNEIEMLVNQYRVQEIHIEDDNFTFNRKRAEKICDLIIERNIKVAFAAPNGLAVWALNEQLLRKLKRAGFYRLTLAIESGSQKTLSKIIHKPLRIERVLEVIKSARKVGFDIDLFFVVGFPGETPEEMQKTFDLGKSLDVSNVKYFIATPYPGTKLLEIARREKLIPQNYNPSDIGINVLHGIITTAYFTPEELEKKILKETMRTHIALFTRHPFRYTIGILRNYIIKDPRAMLLFAWKTLKSKFSK
jgi:magnesium-protoporphyrin IX monomethyl ester (oxidative) cyclase